MKSFTSKITNKINTSKLTASLMSLLLLVGLFSSVLAATANYRASAAEAVPMEGSVLIKNTTQGGEYAKSATLGTNEIGSVQLWQHNLKAPHTVYAKNTTVSFTVDKSSVFGISKSDNGNAVSGTAIANLPSADSSLKYVPGSAKFQYNKGAMDGRDECDTGFEFPPADCYAVVALPDSIVAGGVNLDSYRGGPLSGCNAFHEKIVIRVTVVTPEKPEPKTPATCDLLKVVIVDNRKVTIKEVVYTKNDATINNIVIVWGDGSTETVSVGEVNGKMHQYKDYNKYDIEVKLNTSLGNGITSADCASQVEFTEKCTVPGKEDKDPTDPECKEDCEVDGKHDLDKNDPDCFEPCDKPGLGHLPEDSARCSDVKVVNKPTYIPRTGVSSVVGLMTIVTIAGAVGHRVFSTVKQQ